MSQQTSVNVFPSGSIGEPLSRNDRIRGALFGLFVGDAVAMPVHWYYNIYNLKRDYGQITGYVKPKDNFEGSILNLSNTGGGGRGSDQGEIIGTVINHGKKKYWVRGGNYHYHLGLDAGENTLEAQLTRLLTRTILEKGVYDDNFWLQQYISFMTTPGSHNDTYASTCHRMFFANHVRGKPANECADNDGHNVDAIDALTATIPVILRYIDSPRDIRNNVLKEVVRSVRRTNALDSYVINFSDILVEVIKEGSDLRSAIEKFSVEYGSIRRMVESSRSDPMVACYIDSSFPALLYFAYKYADSPESAVLANANAGGENVARGSALGALLGASHGIQGFPEWAQTGLKAKDSIRGEIEGLISLIESSSGQA